MTELRWTIKMPIKPGYYWMRHSGQKERLVAVASALNFNKEIRFRVYHLPHPNDKGLQYDQIVPSDPLNGFVNGVEWYGPLPNPPDKNLKTT